MVLLRGISHVWLERDMRYGTPVCFSNAKQKCKSLKKSRVSRDLSQETAS
jgi:hypothetical protein